jgi:hypothetical protein
VTVIPHLEGRILLSQSFQALSPLCQIELLRRVYDEAVGDGPQQLSYPTLRSLQHMTSSPNLPFPLLSVPSSLSLSDQWEAIVLREYFLFRKRSSFTSNRERSDLELGFENKIRLSFANQCFSVCAQQSCDLDPPPSPTRPSDRKSQILERETSITLHNLPKNSELVLRSDKMRKRRNF